MVERAWIDRLSGFVMAVLCKVWMSIVGERPLLADSVEKVPSTDAAKIDANWIDI
jgi:lipopolysaccharide/colanic/teichoic acid biosynthesis glycosyltransferase